jgi:hypothetical protein
MTAAKETAIRKSLAKQLDVLEAGLTLVEEEHRLPNPFGGKGYVDIWARDSQGMHVIIELKRSDDAARDALHEIFKYVALFRMNHGIPAHKIRCMVVSTEWHELLVPFAEFTDRTEIQSEGFQLNVDAGGVPVSAHRVTLPSLPSAVKLFHQHSLFLFADEAMRDQMARTVDAAMSRLGAEGYLVISVNYSGFDARVMYRFGVYVVPATIRAETGMDIDRVVREEQGLSDGNDIDAGDFEDEFLGRLSEEVFGETTDEFVAASSESFAAMLDQGWRRTGIIRRGQLVSEQAYSDNDLDRLIVGCEGTNSIIYSRLTKPANRLDWSESVSGSKYCLMGNETWTSCCARLFSLIEEEYSEGAVLINIYNPLCLPEMLFAIARQRDFGFVPKLQIVANKVDGTEGWIATGIIQWDGVTCPSSPESFFEALSEGIENYYLRRHLNEAWPLDAQAMPLHGLHYGVVKSIVRNHEVVSREILTASPDAWAAVTRDAPVTNLNDFLRENSDYVEQFASALDRHVFRM